MNPVAVVVSRPAPLLPKDDVKLANASPGPDLAKPLSPKGDVVPPAAVLSPKGMQPATVAEKRLEPPEPVEFPVPKEVVVPLHPKPVLVVERPSKDEAALDPEALKKEDREIAAATSGKVVAPAASGGAGAQSPAITAAPVVAGSESKKQEALLEKIAQEQKVQKKMLEDLQRELKQELAKHKQDDSTQVRKTNGTADAARPVVAPDNVAARTPVQDSVPLVVASGSISYRQKKANCHRKVPPVQNVPQPVLNQAAPLPAQKLPQHQAQRVEQIVKVPLSIGIQSVARNVQQVPANQQLPNPALPLAQVGKKDEAGRTDSPVAKADHQQQSPVIAPKAGMLPLLPQAPKQVVMHQPQVGIQNAEVAKQWPIAPAADALPKPAKSAVKPLDVIRRRQEVQQPLQQQAPAVPESKPSLVQQPKPVLGQAPQVLPLDASQFAKQAAQVKAEAPVEFLGKPLEVKDQGPRVAPVQQVDNRPLVRKMSRDVKREAPAVAEAPSVVDAVAPKEAVVPLGAVAPKDAAVAVVQTALPLADGERDVPAKNVNVAAFSEVPVKLEPKNISPSLPSHVPADLMLAKHEIRK
ncbi:hypothetical protein MRX96_006110 [Rhipicephalus microplus]